MMLRIARNGLLAVNSTRVSRCTTLLGSTRRFASSSFADDIDTVPLAFDRYDPPGNVKSTKQPILFLHGLFGSKINNRSVSKALARDLVQPVYCLDLRNHGESPHVNRHDYPSMAADIEAFIDEHELGPVTLIGHSMGAKAAMAVSLRHPEKVESLISVDNAPIDTRLSSSFYQYIQGMKEIQRAHLSTQKEAYSIMEKYERALPVQQFLLSNLRRDPKSKKYDFRVPVDILSKALDRMGDFPFLPSEARFSKPALFIRGKYSPYVADEAFPAIGEFFPRFVIRDVDSGHWVISEKPHDFLTITKEFLADDV